MLGAQGSHRYHHSRAMGMTILISIIVEVEMCCWPTNRGTKISSKILPMSRYLSQLKLNNRSQIGCFLHLTERDRLNFDRTREGTFPYG